MPKSLFGGSINDWYLNGSGHSDAEEDEGTVPLSQQLIDP